MPDSENWLLEIRQLSIRYSTRNGEVVRALDHLSLELCESEIIGIMGESGCGKSTLANSMLCLLPGNATVENGTVLFRGNNMLSLTEQELSSIRGRQISLVPQDPALSLNPVIAVGTQIGEVLRAHMPLSSRQRRDRVMELLQEVGFDQPSDVYGAYAHQLSGGQRQRVVIAQAIACRPTLLIADEPTSKLDPELRFEMVRLLARTCATHGTALIVISHDLTLVAAIADQVAFMYRGRIVETGRREDVFRRPIHPYTKALLGIARSGRIDGEGEKHRFPTTDDELIRPAPTTMGLSV